ncbi:MAG: DUF971 domain-containing protein [Tepidisphaeraceae bacterium]
MAAPQLTPIRLDLKKDEQLEIDWQDGLKSVYSLTLLRSMCPGAQCRMVRDGTDPHDISPGVKKKPLLTILPGNYSGALTVVNAEMVGNYAIRIDWSDDHGSGIYSFQYLRDISPTGNAPMTKPE